MVQTRFRQRGALHRGAASGRRTDGAGALRGNSAGLLAAAAAGLCPTWSESKLRHLSRSLPRDGKLCPAGRVRRLLTSLCTPRGKDAAKSAPMVYYTKRNKKLQVIANL